MNVEQGHDDVRPVQGRQLVSVCDVQRASHNVQMQQGHGLWSGGGTAGMQNQSNIAGTSKPWESDGVYVNKLGVVQRPVDNLLVIVLWRVDVVFHSEPGCIKAQFHNKTPERCGGFQNLGVGQLCSALRNADSLGLQIVQVEIELLFLIVGVQGSTDLGVHGGPKEGDDELQPIAHGDRHSVLSEDRAIQRRGGITEHGLKVAYHMGQVPVGHPECPFQEQ